MRPPVPWAIIRRPAARQQRNWPFKFTPSTRSQSLSGISTMGELSAKPATLTRMSTAPQAAASSNIESTCAAIVTSTAAARALPPDSAIRRAADSAPSKLRSAMVTAAPAAARVKAISRPMPDAAPVTIAHLPSSSIKSSLATILRMRRYAAGPAAAATTGTGACLSMPRISSGYKWQATIRPSGAAASAGVSRLHTGIA